MRSVSQDVGKCVYCGWAYCRTESNLIAPGLRSSDLTFHAMARYSSHLVAERENKRIPDRALTSSCSTTTTSLFLYLNF